MSAPESFKYMIPCDAPTIRNSYQSFNFVASSKRPNSITSIARDIDREVSMMMLLGIFLFSLTIFVDAKVFIFEKDEPSTCLTGDCIQFARSIRENMQPSTNPCEDFYKYACGNWPRIHPLPEGEHSWIMRMIPERENKRKVDEMLMKDSRDDEIPPVKIAKQWYKDCLNTDEMNERGMEPLVSILNEIGGWPITMPRNKWIESNQKWQNIDDYYAHLTGSNLLHDTRVAAYGGKSKILSAVIDVPNMPQYAWMLEEFSDSENDTTIEGNGFKVNEKYREFIIKIVSNVARAEGFNVPKFQLEEDIENLMNFTWKLSKITTLLDDYVNMTLKDFQKWYNDLGPSTENSMVNWADKVIHIFKESGIDLSQDTVIKISSPGYFENLVLLLDKTPSRTIVNYLHWNFVSNAIKTTTDEMRELLKKMDGDEGKNQSRSDLCIEESQMNDVIAYDYMKTYFLNSTINLAFDALEDMEREIEIEIESSNWANKEIKNLALRRIKHVKRNIGYPEWYNNATIMENYFGGLKIGSTYFENSLKLRRYYKLRELWLLKHKNEIKSWLVDPLTLNAFYLSESNSITVPLANLQRPFFSGTQTNTINYALTGYLMAHELYHPFDELKRLYNENGTEISWSEKMTEEYYKSAQCFVQQFNEYTLDGTPLGPKIENYGNQTFDENMADTMGLKTAFKAYKRRENRNGKLERALPGLKRFSNDQIFFLSFANLWCEKKGPETLVTDAKLDVHSVPHLRVIGSVSNNQDFANAFSCPLGSPMNPKKKCNIWKV